MLQKDTKQNIHMALGKIFAELRKKRGVSQAAISEKLLTQHALSNFEKKGELPNWLVITTLFQRLGKNADYFVPILSKEEYEYLLWKCDIFRKMHRGIVTEHDWKCEMAHSEAIHPALQKQFVMFWKGFLSNNISAMQEAITLTMPGYPGILSTKSCIGTDEIAYLLICMEKKLQLCPKKWKEEQPLLESVLRYIEVCYQKDEQIKVYYKAVCLYGSYMQGADVFRKMGYYNNALLLHRELANLTGLSEILRGIVRESEKLGLTEAVEYREYLDTLEGIQWEYGIEENSFANRQLSQEFYLLHEILATYRKEKNLKVSDIDLHTCSEKTYRALEKGKRNANKGTYDLLADYMGIPFPIVSSEIVTDKYSDLVLVARIRQAGQQENVRERLRLLSKLEDSLGEKANIPENRQYINSVRDLGLLLTGNISPLEYKDRVEKTIRLTIPEWKIGYGNHFYTRREMMLIYYEAIALRRLKQYDTAINLLEDMWKRLETSEVNKIYRMHETLLIMSLWKNLLTEIGKYDEAMDMVDEGIKLCFLSGRGNMLDTFVFEKGWSLEQKYPQMTMEDKIAKCLPYIRATICLERLFFQKNSQQAVEKYFSEHYKKEPN